MQIKRKNGEKKKRKEKTKYSSKKKRKKLQEKIGGKRIDIKNLTENLKEREE